MINWEDLKSLLQRYDLQRKVAAATSVEGLVLGNADMGAVIFGPAHRLCFRLNKQNLWDSRWNAEHYQQPLPMSQLKAFVTDHSVGLAYGETLPQQPPGSWGGNDRLFPCMRSGADLLLRVAQLEPGFIQPNMTQRLRLADGVYHAEFPNLWRPPGPYLTCEAFIAWQYNVLALRLSVPDYWADRRRTVVSLLRDPWGGRSWELLSAGVGLREGGEGDFRRDPRVDALPPAELAIHNRAAELFQAIPGDEWFPGNDFAVVATPGEEALDFSTEPSGQLAMELGDHLSATVFIGMANALDGVDPLAHARRLSLQAAAEGWDALYAEHARAWREFWMASAVDVDDAALQKRWVLGSYEMATTLRAGKSAPGLYGVATPHDGPPWKGDRHNNYPEFSSRFWGAFTGNHPEQARVYTEFVHSYLPTARRIAREVYECEEGAAYPALYFDGTSRYFFHPQWSHGLFLTALHAQNCWFHYQYFGDEAFLREMAYPVMRACVDFYDTLLQKNAPGDYTLWPTMVSELHCWTRNFEKNQNCIEDIAHLKFLLRAMLEASEILDTDADKRPRWREILANLPDYPTLRVEGREEFTDVPGETERPPYNIQVQLCPLWPAEDPDVVNNPRLREIAANTLLATKSIFTGDHLRRMIGKIRLGLTESLWSEIMDWPLVDGEDSNAQIHDSQGNPFPVTEMLLNSWDGVIRLFPGWPLTRHARFSTLRTKGAFLVSAACADGRMTDVEFLSERGNRLRLLEPWPGARIVRDSGEEVTVERENGILSWDTAPGERFTVQ
jgi:hypothetical protein